MLWAAVLTASLRLWYESCQISVNCCWKSQTETTRRKWTSPPSEGHYGCQSAQVLGPGLNQLMSWILILPLTKKWVEHYCFQWYEQIIFNFMIFCCRMCLCLKVSSLTCSLEWSAPNQTMVYLWRPWKRTLERGNYSVYHGSWTKSFRYLGLLFCLFLFISFAFLKGSKIYTWTSKRTRYGICTKIWLLGVWNDLGTSRLDDCGRAPGR